MQSKSTLETALAHRSIRKFTDEPISENLFQQLIAAGQSASSSNHLQCVTVIRVTDQDIRQQISALSSMAYVAECAEFLVFCIDFSKHKQLQPESQLDWAEVSLIGAVDVGIFAQNVLLTAESLGLGGVYIGALRNEIEAVATLLHLPQYCVPMTLVVENVWGKARILEVYLNVAEFGDGIFGVEAAARHFFNKSANQLSLQEAALLAASLPNPQVYRVNKPGPTMRKRQAWIMRQVNNLGGKNYLEKL